MKKIIICWALAILITIPQLVAAQSKELVICGWGGAMEDAQRKTQFEPFEKETGIKIIAVAPPSPAKLKAMVESGNVEWDLVYAGYPMYGPCLKQGLLEKVDYKYFDKATLDEMFAEAKLSHAVGSFFFSIVMAYNTDVYPTGKQPKNWVEFWDAKKFPGPRTLFDPSVVGGGWEFGLLGAGVPKDRLYADADIKPALDSFKRIKPSIVKWWRQGQEPGQLLVNKEVVLANAYNGRIQQLKEQGAPVELEWNQGMLWLEYLFIPKGAKNYDNACRFLAFQSKAQPQADIAKIMAYGPVNQKSFELLTPERAKVLSSYPANKAVQFNLNEDWYAKNMEQVIERWNSWILEK